MGKGDRRTKRGKIFAGTFGKCRPKAKNKAVKEVTTNQVSETKSEEKAEE